MEKIVAKFGGTSMGSAEAMMSAAAILEKQSGLIVGVVSAVSGTTDTLIRIGREALEKGPWRETLRALQEKHETIVNDLAIVCDLSAYWMEIENIAQGVEMLGELSLSTLDRLQGFGERMSATILIALLEKRGTRAIVVNGYDIVCTDDNFGSANVDFAKTYARIYNAVSPLLADSILPIVTGFIGQAANGQYSTLGRGGSDYSGAIVAAAIDATECQIWTDVDGILNTDPRLVPSAKVLDQLSFYEAGELAYFGAKVLHPKTIKPAVEKNIPVRILNTFNPSARGTVITNEVQESLKAVTYKKGITMMTISSLGMLNAHGFLAKIFDVFASQKVVVDVVATSEVSVSLTIDCKPSLVLQGALMEFSTVEIQEQKAIVCLVGEGIRTQKHVLKTLFSAIQEFDVAMISQGASRRNITFVVSEDDAKAVVKKVFDAFFV